MSKQRGWWLSKLVPLLLCPQAALGGAGVDRSQGRRDHLPSAAHLPPLAYTRDTTNPCLNNSPASVEEEECILDFGRTKG